MMSKDCLIIGFAGAAGSGKDTAAGMTANHPYLWHRDYETQSFASPIKHCIAAIFDISLHHQNDPSLKNIIDPHLGKSPRELAQFFGTEVGRNILSPWMGYSDYSVWIKSLEFRTHESTELVLIPDVRFQDEADWIFDRGSKNIIIHLTRPGADGKVGIPGHISEAGFIPKDRSRYYEILNDSYDPAILRDKLYAVLDSCNFS